MNIAVVRRKYDPLGGGAEKYASYVVEELIRRGHSITVFAEKSDNVPAHINIVTVPRPLLPPLCRTASFAACTDRVLDRSKFDLVFALSRYVGADLYRQAEQLHAVWLPIYYSWLSRFNPRHSGILNLERRVFDPQGTGGIVTNSELVRSQVIDIFGFPSGGVRVIRNGVDRDKYYPSKTTEEKSEARKRIGVGSDKNVLLFVAGNFAIKGLDKAIASIAALPDSQQRAIVLVVVGGDKPDPFVKIAEELGVAANVIFAGKQNDMRAYYIGADMLFYPSLYEPFANVCLESCACATPVLTTAQNGSSELIEHGKNGYIVEHAGLVEEMTKCLSDYLIKSNEQKEHFSQLALKATDGYSWTGHVDALESLFIDIQEKKQS